MVIKIYRFLSGFQPSTVLIFGYLLLVFTGMILLSLPFAQKGNINVLDNLFIVTSAASTMGLATISVSDNYTFFGQLIVISLIQVGGIGYMSIASFIIVGGKKKLSQLSARLLKTEFDLSEQYDVRNFVKIVMWFSLIIELVGAAILYFIFASNAVENPVWNAIFHSISAYCTAGFSLFNTGFEQYAGHAGLNFTIGFLSLAGCIGFIVFADLYQKIARGSEHITFTSKIILRFTFWILFVATFILFISESTWSAEPTETQWLLSFFQVMTSVTTVGFNTIPIGDLSNASLFFLVIMMLSGASPAGTGGGIKSTTITAMFAITRCTLRGQHDVVFMGVRIPTLRLRMAVANFFFYFGIVGIGIFLLLLTEHGNPYALIFEAISALGTVGLSMGATSSLSVMGKIIVILLMFLGRIGALTFGLALLNEDEPGDDETKEEDIAL